MVKYVVQSGPLVTFGGPWISLEKAKTSVGMRSVVGAMHWRQDCVRCSGSGGIGAVATPRPPQPSLAGPQSLSSCTTRAFRLPFPSSLLFGGFSAYVSERTGSLVVLLLYGVRLCSPGTCFLPSHLVVPFCVTNKLFCFGAWLSFLFTKSSSSVCWLRCRFAWLPVYVANWGF